MRLIGSLLLFSATLLADPSLLPLQNGNTWTYQERGRQASFTVRVGTPAVIGGNVYYRLIGYVTEPLWVRWGNFDTLYYRDEEKEQDFPLTVFQRNTGGRFQAPFRFCDSLGRAEDGGKHDGPIGPMTATIRIRYVNLDCADVGVVDEQYASNIGMIERTEQSFGGPRLFDLVSARIGASTIQTGPGTNLGVTLRKPENKPGLLAILELRVNDPDPVTLHYLSSQEFDAIIRDEHGTSLWQWSEGKPFLPRIMDEITYGRSWTIDVPLTDRAGAALPAGKYSLEAWIASGVDRTQFAGTAPFRIPGKE